MLIEDRGFHQTLNATFSLSNVQKEIFFVRGAWCLVDLKRVFAPHVATLGTGDKQSALWTGGGNLEQKRLKSLVQHVCGSAMAPICIVED